MRRTVHARTAAGVATAAVLLVPLPGRAAPSAPAGGDPQLTGTTVVTARHSSWAIVDLPRAVRLRTQPGPGEIRGLELQGAGRFVGLALVSLDHRSGFVQLRMSACWHQACDAEPGPRTRPQIADSWSVTKVPPPSVNTKVQNWFRLPAGRYVLSLYSDGTPVRATLPLPGLGGTSHLALHLDRHSQAATPTVQRIGAGPLTTATLSSADGTVGTPVVVLGMAHKERSSPHVSNDDWWCYSTDPPPGGVTAPYCPDGSGVGIGITWVTLQYRSFSYGLAVETGPGAINGRVYQGSSDSGIQNLGDVHDNFFWADAGLPRQGG